MTSSQFVFKEIILHFSRGPSWRKLLNLARKWLPGTQFDPPVLCLVDGRSAVDPNGVSLRPSGARQGNPAALVVSTLQSVS